MKSYRRLQKFIGITLVVYVTVGYSFHSVIGKRGKISSIPAAFFDGILVRNDVNDAANIMSY